MQEDFVKNSERFRQPVGKLNHFVFTITHAKCDRKVFPDNGPMGNPLFFQGETSVAIEV